MPAFGEHRKNFYPGLGPEETKTWRAWLVENEQDWERFEYRVVVGDGVRAPRGTYSPDPTTDAKYVDLQKALTQRKIDVVAYRGSEIMLIEIKERADVRSLGQLLLYEGLFMNANPSARDVSLAVVCRYVGADMGEALQQNDVTPFVVSV